MCIIRNNGKCGTLHFSGTRHSNGMLLLCAAAEAEQQQNQKTAFSCGNQPTRKAVFVFRAWQTHCCPVEYAIVTRSSREQQCVQLTAMLLTAEPCVNPCCVDIAVSKNICQMLQIMLCPIEAHGEQVPEVVGKDLLRRNSGCGA